MEQNVRKRNVPQEEELPSPSSTRQLLRTFKNLDVYPKMEEEYEVQTSCGAAVSIVSGIIILTLLFSNLAAYFQTHVNEHIVVDTRKGQTMAIYFNITFPSLRCSQLHVDVMDVSGENQLDAKKDTTRWRLDANGKPIGQPTQELAAGDEASTGCCMYGSVHVNKVAGNVHIAVGSSLDRDGRHVHQFHATEMINFNASHIINHLSFGEDFKGSVNPLNGAQQIATTSAHFQYFIKVVPTTYVNVYGDELETNQYSVTEHTHLVNIEAVMKNSQKIPGVFFFYDLSPFMVRVVETKTSFLHFLTNVCAIIGGVFTVAGIVDSCVFHFSRLAKKGL